MSHQAYNMVGNTSLSLNSPNHHVPYTWQDFSQVRLADQTALKWPSEEGPRHLGLDPVLDCPKPCEAQFVDHHTVGVEEDRFDHTLPSKMKSSIWSE